LHVEIFKSAKQQREHLEGSEELHVGYLTGVTRQRVIIQQNMSSRAS
jgi:hypothetical protein